MRQSEYFHSRDLRSGRRSLPGHAYLITTVCADRKPIFGEFETACVAARAFADRALWRDSTLLAWVLMPDHWHGLVQLGPSEPLSRVIGRAKAVSARAVNLALRAEDGDPVWQDGFHDRALRRDEGLRGAARYLLANPLRAGLAASTADYPFWDAAWAGVERDLA